MHVATISCKTLNAQSGLGGVRFFCRHRHGGDGRINTCMDWMAETSPERRVFEQQETMATLLPNSRGLISGWCVVDTAIMLVVTP